MRVLPSNLVKIILGDFNVKIGKDIGFKPTIGQHSLHDYSNDNGVRVISFASSKYTTISSTFFPRKHIHKQTWMFPGGLLKIKLIMS